MATIKSYTDVSQSKVLAKILPLGSADMIYTMVNGRCTPFIRIETIEEMYEDDVLCWSLAALLGVLPRSITKYIDNEKCQKTFHLNLFRSYYYCCSYSFAPSISDDDGDNTLYCVGRNNWVDACVAMVEKLHELKML